MFKLFQNLEETSRFCYYLELRKKYEVEFGAQSSYLAVQVINYLMGFDFNKFYSSVGDEVKIEIDKIKDYIITKADEEMGIPEIKEWVDRVLMNKVVLYSSKYDTYTKSKEFANIEILINKYFKENFCEKSDNFDSFVDFTVKFINKRDYLRKEVSKE